MDRCVLEMFGKNSAGLAALLSLGELSYFNLLGKLHSTTMLRMSSLHSRSKALRLNTIYQQLASNDCLAAKYLMGFQQGGQLRAHRRHETWHRRVFLVGAAFVLPSKQSRSALADCLAVLLNQTISLGVQAMDRGSPASREARPSRLSRARGNMCIALLVRSRLGVAISSSLILMFLV